MEHLVTYDHSAHLGTCETAVTLFQGKANGWETNSGVIKHIMFATFVKIKAEKDAMWTGSKLRDGYKIYIDSICDTKLNWYENARSTMYLELKYPLLLAWAKQQIPWGLTKSSFQMPNNCLEKKSFFFFFFYVAESKCVLLMIMQQPSYSDQIPPQNILKQWQHSNSFVAFQWALTVQTRAGLGVCQARHPETALKRSATFGAVVSVVVARQRYKHLIDSDMYSMATVGICTVIASVVNSNHLWNPLTHFNSSP